MRITQKQQKDKLITRSLNEPFWKQRNSVIFTQAFQVQRVVVMRTLHFVIRGDFLIPYTQSLSQANNERQATTFSRSQDSPTHCFP